jgi:hypothetical protein
LKILSEIIDTENAKIVWKGIGFAEDIKTSKTIDAGLFSYNARNPEIEEFIDNMVRVAVNGLISEISNRQKR